VRIVAVIPVKPAAECKQRLAPMLDRGLRQRLVQIMLDCVVRALDSAHGLAGIAVLTNDESLVPRGVERIADPGGGINAALAAAAVQLSAQGAQGMLVLPGDVPRVTGSDIEGLLELARHGRAIVVPDARGSGTNALLLAPPALLAPQFGPRSLAAHLEAARAVGVPAIVHGCPNISRDIDEPGDVAALLDPAADARFGFLRSLQGVLC